MTELVRARFNTICYFEIIVKEKLVIEFILFGMGISVIIMFVVGLVILNRNLQEIRVEADFWRVRYLATLPSHQHKQDAITACELEIEAVNK